MRMFARKPGGVLVVLLMLSANAFSACSAEDKQKNDDDCEVDSDCDDDEFCDDGDCRNRPASGGSGGSAGSTSSGGSAGRSGSGGSGGSTAPVAGSGPGGGGGTTNTTMDVTFCSTACDQITQCPDTMTLTDCTAFCLEAVLMARSVGCDAEYFDYVQCQLDQQTCDLANIQAACEALYEAVYDCATSGV